MVRAIGAPELLIILLLLVGPAALVLAIVVIVDASGRADASWDAIGQSRTVWIVVSIVLLLFCLPASLVASITYFVSVRPKLVGTKV
jgi:hypothetical protein